MLDDSICFNCPLPDCTDPCPFGVKDNYNIDILKELNLYDNSYDELFLDEPDPQKRYLKIYYIKNRNKLIKRSRSYYRNNKQSILIKNHDYYLKHKDKLSKKKREYYLANREKILKQRHIRYCLKGV